ncbi:MAG: methionine gamma-lyase family protein [Oscillospiraceae bacterium]|nr:methionine gamma-lyase family protein [Oscillospiraceae bacterium]
MSLADIPAEMLKLAEKVEARLADRFSEIDSVSEKNTLRVMESFSEYRVSDSCFAGTTGYGYNDAGREITDKIYARVFGTEAALVRPGIVSGTHAIAAALFAALKPGDTLLSATGAPYDTIKPVIGIPDRRHGSLLSLGVEYRQVELTPSGEPDHEAVFKAVSDARVKAAFIQRSGGYADRRALATAEIGELIKTLKSANDEIITVVDNCYGEFVETREPTHAGADIAAGSLIKNPGGGLAPFGGYVAGREELVERAAERVTVPGTGSRCGATPGTGRLILQGFFLAPHTVAQALKTACFSAGILEEFGFDTLPGATEARADIIQRIRFKSAENMLRFCRGIQSACPVDSYAVPEPGPMPGYDCPVIMAAGTFIQGSSIELSCDGPMREPYTGYLQGGLTYESGKLSVMAALGEMRLQAAAGPKGKGK